MLTIARRAKKMTQISEKVATGTLSGVVKVTGYFTSSLVNSKAGKKFFNLLPGEIVLASLDGFGKCLLFAISTLSVLAFAARSVSFVPLLFFRWRCSVLLTFSWAGVEQGRFVMLSKSLGRMFSPHHQP